MSTETKPRLADVKVGDWVAIEHRGHFPHEWARMPGDELYTVSRVNDRNFYVYPLNWCRLLDGMSVANPYRLARVPTDKELRDHLAAIADDEAWETLREQFTASEAQHRIATWPVIAAALTDALGWLELQPGGLGESAKISYIAAREAIAAAEGTK